MATFPGVSPSSLTISLRLPVCLYARLIGGVDGSTFVYQGRRPEPH